MVRGAAVSAKSQIALDGRRVADEIRNSNSSCVPGRSLLPDDARRGPDRGEAPRQGAVVAYIGKQWPFTDHQSALRAPSQSRRGQVFSRIIIGWACSVFFDGRPIGLGEERRPTEGAAI